MTKRERIKAAVEAAMQLINDGSDRFAAMADQIYNLHLTESEIAAVWAWIHEIEG